MDTLNKNTKYELIGMKFNRLTPVGRGRKRPDANLSYLCKCDCGNNCYAAKYDLVRGLVKSCGCYERERNPRGTRHSHASTKTGISPTYSSWKHMRDRCLNPNFKQFKDYGGRGITICERWGDFVNFIADMGERPIGMTLERKDRNGNYEPSNCKWATRKDQQNNTSRTRPCQINGVSYRSTQEAAETLNINLSTLRWRLDQKWEGYVRREK